MRIWVLKNNKKLSHLNKKGEAKMVNINEKIISDREAIARCEVNVSKEIIKLILENNIKKGDVVQLSKIAGIMGAKRTHELIPLCHNIPLSEINIDIIILEDSSKLSIEASVKAEWKTGVEMEALTAVSITALSIYDMCKSIDKHIEINSLKLIKKSGGKSGDFINQ